MNCLAYEFRQFRQYEFRSVISKWLRKMILCDLFFKKLLLSVLVFMWHLYPQCKKKRQECKLVPLSPTGCQGQEGPALASKSILVPRLNPCLFQGRVLTSSLQETMLEKPGGNSPCWAAVPEGRKHTMCSG